jgi:hypothetical protein
MEKNGLTNVVCLRCGRVVSGSDELCGLCADTIEFKGMGKGASEERLPFHTLREAVEDHPGELFRSTHK